MAVSSDTSNGSSTAVLTARVPVETKERIKALAESPLSDVESQSEAVARILEDTV